MTLLKNPKKLLLLIILVTVAIIAIFGFKKVIKKNDVNWKIYKNVEAGYELSYPSDWHIFDLQTAFGFRVQNKKKLSSKSETEMYCQRCSYFAIYVSDLSLKYPAVKTMEDLITRNKPTYPEYEEPEGLIYEATKERNKKEYEEQKEIYFSRAIKSQQEEINNLVEMDIGNIKTKVSIHKVNPYTWRLNFIYDGIEYEIVYVSGSLEQFKKDDEIFEAIINSIKIY